MKFIRRKVQDLRLSEEAPLVVRTYLTPEREQDIPLFMHCLAGRAMALEETFDNEVYPLLQAHGVKSVSIVDEKAGKNEVQYHPV